MFEAVARIQIKGTVAFAKAATIIGAGCVGCGDPANRAVYAGDWDPDEISAEEKKAFLEAIAPYDA